MTKTTSVTFRPLHDNVLIRRKERDDKTAGGIIIPDKAKERPVEGEVISVGPGVFDSRSGKVIALTVKPGDKVLFSMHAGSYVRVINDEELVSMKESDIHGIVE